MKKIFNLVAILTMGMTMFSSCSDDDNISNGGEGENGSSIPEIVDDKQFLEDVGNEFVGMFTAEQATPYTSIINVIKESSTKVIDDDINNIIDGLTSKTGTNPEVYKYAIKAAAFNGTYRLKDDGEWYKEAGNSLRAEFKDDMSRQCVLTVKKSDDAKKVIVYEDDRYRWNYGEKYMYKQYLYEVELPSHIECLLTQGGSQLINVDLNLDLSGLTANERINLSHNSLSFECTADFAGVAKINVEKVGYVAQGTSEVKFDVVKNGKKILIANATTYSNLSGVPEKIDDNQLKRITDTKLNLNILDKVQIEGICSNIYSLTDVLDKANHDDENEQVVRQYVNQANNLIQAKVYYNNDKNTERASLLFDVDYREYHYYYNGKDNSWTEYFPTTSIKFADGSSYFMENYFTEDAFKSLVDMFNDLTDKVETQIDEDEGY